MVANFVSPWSNNQPQNSGGGFKSPWSNAPQSTPSSSFVPMTADDLGGQPPAPQPGPSGQGSGFFSNLWNGMMNGGKSAMDFVGHKFNDFENFTGLNHIGGAAKGLSNPQQFHSNPWANDGSYLGGYKNMAGELFTQAKNLGESAIQGFQHPDETAQNFGDTFAKATQHLDPVTRAALNFEMNAGTDPLTFLPVGPIASLIGKGVKAGSAAVGATPYIQSAVNAVKASKPVTAASNALGKAFVPNYGATRALDDILKQGKGEYALHQYNNLNAFKALQQGHGLTPDQLSQIGHITEQTLQGTPGQHTLAQSLSSLLENGAPGSGVGSDLMSRTASAVSGDPLLEGKLPNYFPHLYNNVPDELKGVFPKQQEGVGGLSANGTYNLPRTFTTLQEAQNAGLKPESNPFLATGTRLDQMSKAYTNNNIIQQIKNTQGLLFDKNPIDEVNKLIKTGRMTADQAAAQLGMTVDDMKKGFVQSKIPQLRGAYIRPADEAALTEHLQPARPEGILGASNKLNNLYNKGFLLNPLPHLHNVTTNGVVLGGAKPEYIKDALSAIKSGSADPFYQRAIKAGAVNNPVEGSFTKAITHQAPTNVFSKARQASHDLLWNTDAAIRTALFRDAVEKGMSDSAAAAHTNKFMVDYNNITPFERKYIKPVVPFYAWKKGNIPLQVSQTFAQTPKYVALQHAKDAVSEGVSGQPLDQKGRIMTGETLPDGSQVALDPYIPMDEPEKIMDKGPIPWALGSINPIVREAQAQGSSLLGAFAPGTGIQNKFPIYNPSAPADYNIRKGLAHAISGLNPFGSSAILGEAGNQANWINGGINAVADHVGGNSANDISAKDKPGQTTSELITKLFGGFSGRDNPQKDAVNQQYQSKDDAANQIKYLKSTGQPVPKSLQKQAYKRVRVPIGQ